MKLLEMNHIKKEFDGLGVLKDISLKSFLLSVLPVPANPRCFAARRCLRRLTAERSCTWGKKLPG